MCEQADSGDFGEEVIGFNKLIWLARLIILIMVFELKTFINFVNFSRFIKKLSQYILY